MSAAASIALAGNIDPDDQGFRFAWGENIGWINFSPSQGPGVTVSGSAVTGMAWGENIGWINFSPATDGGVLNDGMGRLSGTAWGENVGWLNFAPVGGGVVINACGEFDGAAWGENIGWIRFRSTGPAPFKLVTSWVSPLDDVAPVTSLSGPAAGWNRSAVSVTLSATDCGSSVREVRHVLDGLPEVVTPGSGASFTIADDGIHSLSYFAIDTVDNAESARLASILIDKTPPAITVSVPAAGSSFYKNQQVTADFSAADATSGLAGVTSTFADGQAIDTSTLGARTFDLLATDHAGNAASITNDYAIVTCSPELGPAGIVTTYAGGGTAYGEGGPATSAHIYSAQGVGLDPAGNVYVADGGWWNLGGGMEAGPVIRRIDAATGIITTVAGSVDRFDWNGSGEGDGGPATAASLGHIFDVAVDTSGNLYICDNFSNRIRKVDAATGIIATVAGDGDFVSDGDGGPAIAASLGFPLGVEVDAAGNLYIADSFDVSIRKVTAATGIINRFAGRPPDFSCSGCADCSTGDGGPALDATFTAVMGVAVDDAGNVYVADDCRVRRIDATTGIITAVAGGGTGTGESGPATEANLGQVSDVEPDGSGNLVITGYERVWRVDADGNIGVFAGTGVGGFSGDGGPAVDATFSVIAGVAAEGDGDVYIADGSDAGGGSGSRVRRVTVDADGDGLTDCLDPDDDNDGASDAAEEAAGSDPRDPASTPEVCDGLDNDLDGQIDEGFAYPANIGPTLQVGHAAAGQILFTWTDATFADDYIVIQDSMPNGPFATVTGTASSGAAGLTVPPPAGDLVYFLVAGRNAACGEGPRR